MPPVAARSALVLAVVVSASAALAGCSGQDAPEPAATTGAPSATALPTEPAASPTATATPTAPEGEPVTLGCDEVFPPRAVYEFNPNFGTDPGYTPAAGSLAAEIVALNGVACGWLNQTSGVTVEVAVANLPEPLLTDRRNAAQSASTRVHTYGDEGYFRMVGGRGEAQLFAGAHWIVITSDGFLEPGDVVPVSDPVLSALG